MRQGFGCSRGTSVPGTESIGTAHPPHAGVSQTRTGAMPRAPTGNSVPWQDHRKSQGKNVRARKHQLKMPLIQRGWRASPPAQISERGKLFPVTHPCVGLYIFALWKEILELESKAGAQQKTMAGISTRQLCLPTTRAALWNEQTRTDGAQDKAATPRQTDLYLTAAVTACGRKRGQRSQSPKVHTAGEEEMLSQLSEKNQELTQ